MGQKPQCLSESAAVIKGCYMSGKGTPLSEGRRDHTETEERTEEER